jgi:hypothetical protein
MVSSLEQFCCRPTGAFDIIVCLSDLTRETAFCPHLFLGGVRRLRLPSRDHISHAR